MEKTKAGKIGGKKQEYLKSCQRGGGIGRNVSSDNCIKREINKKEKVSKSTSEITPAEVTGKKGAGKKPVVRLPKLSEK